MKRKGINRYRKTYDAGTERSEQPTLSPKLLLSILAAVLLLSLGCSFTLQHKNTPSLSPTATPTPLSMFDNPYAGPVPAEETTLFR